MNCVPASYQIDKQPLFLHTFKDKILIVRSPRLTFGLGLRMDAEGNFATAELSKVYLAAICHHLCVCLTFVYDRTCHRHCKRLEFTITCLGLNRIQIFRSISMTAPVESKIGT